jgi:glycosyltransferase involved in cell wall biosynthesis
VRTGPGLGHVDNPLVSVVIAAYNMADYLPLAVQSVLAQTYQPVEVVVVDDGSTDHTAEAMAPLLGDSRVVYVKQKNGGQAVAKNRGIQESRARYVAFLDADDLWTADKLELQMPLLLKSPAVGVVYSRVGYIDEHGSDTGVADNELFRGRISGPMLIRNFIGFGTSVVKKECFERLGSFNEAMKMGIDYDLWLRFSTQYEFEYVDKPLLRYRIWAGQMSHNCQGRYRAGLDTMKRFLEKYPDAVDRKTWNEAWAHTFVGYAHCMNASGGGIIAAMKLFGQALRHRPSYFPAWRGMLTTMLGIK